MYMFKKDIIWFWASLKGDQSEWHGYLQSLPTGTVDLPLFWDQATSQDDSVDGMEALGWLRGTAVERILLVQEDGSTLIVRRMYTLPSAVTLADINELCQDAIYTYYHQVAAPLLLDRLDLWRGPMCNREPTLCGFHRSFSLVSSRAFLVDSYHGLSMVPIADALVIYTNWFAAMPNCSISNSYSFNHVQENHVHLEVGFFSCAKLVFTQNLHRF
jgi:N-lysine methyltransferase SETD6